MYETNMVAASSLNATQINSTGHTFNRQGTAIDPDVSPVSRQTTLIQKLLAEHRDMQASMGQRLHAVLRPVGPEAEQANGEPRPARSPLTSDLEDFAAALQSLLNGYHYILNRLEL